jgi:hypothetical protein
MGIPPKHSLESYWIEKAQQDYDKGVRNYLTWAAPWQRDLYLDAWNQCAARAAVQSTDAAALQSHARRPQRSMW